MLLWRRFNMCQSSAKENWSRSELDWRLTPTSARDDTMAPSTGRGMGFIVLLLLTSVCLNAIVTAGGDEIERGLRRVETFPSGERQNIHDLQNAWAISIKLAQGVAKLDNTVQNSIRPRQATFGVGTVVSADLPSPSNTEPLCHTPAVTGATSARVIDIAHIAHSMKGFVSCERIDSRHVGARRRSLLVGRQCRVLTPCATISRDLLHKD